jgi:hypothetical protein
MRIKPERVLAAPQPTNLPARNHQPSGLHGVHSREARTDCSGSEGHMTARDKRYDRVDLLDEAAIPTTVEHARGILERRRERTAERKCRVLVRSLRRAAKGAKKPHPIARRRQPLLHYRAAAVRSELLEITAMLERTYDPDPASIAALHELLANGCDSPLYNPEVHVSELCATVYGVRMGLLTQARHSSPGCAEPEAGFRQRES